MLDFSANCNPLGPSPLALEALARVDVARYPDPTGLALRSALAAATGLSPDRLLIGNGSVELIWLLADVFLDAGDEALVVGPTFGEYAAAIRRAGARALEVTADERDDFRPDLAPVTEAIRGKRPRLVYLCNPNNPTGTALDLPAIRSLLGALGQGLLVVDEAYVDFSFGVDTALALLDDARVVVLRSMTKSLGLAGLRLGYAAADPCVIDALGRARPPWTVNALALAAGVASLADGGHVASGLQVVSAAWSYLNRELGALGVMLRPSVTSFWLGRVADPPGLRLALLRHGLQIRDCSSFGLPHHVRIAARPLAECQRLVEVWGLLARP
ncbi:MAG: histidinol-phosphate transaminase [Chloroflexota bacterium]